MKSLLIQKSFFIQKKGKKEKITAHILDFPNLVQPNDYACGVVCVQSILRYYGDTKRRECELENILKVDEVEGMEIKHIVQFFKKEKFKVDARQMTIKDLETYLKKGIPIIVILQARSKKKMNYAKTWYEGHYAVIIGYNKDYLFFTDPLIHGTCYLRKKEFLSRRHQENTDGTQTINYGIAVYGKKPKHDSLSLQKID